MTTGFRTACLPRAGSAFGVRGVLAPLLGPRFLRPKATRRRVALQSFAKSSSESFTFLFAFIRVIRGLNFGCDGATLGRVVLNCSSNFRCRAPPRCASRFIPFSTKSSACERPAVADRDSSQKPNTALPSIFFHNMRDRALQRVLIIGVLRVGPFFARQIFSSASKNRTGGQAETVRFHPRRCDWESRQHRRNGPRMLRSSSRSSHFSRKIMRRSKQPWIFSGDRLRDTGRIRLLPKRRRRRLIRFSKSSRFRRRVHVHSSPSAPFPPGCLANLRPGGNWIRPLYSVHTGRLSRTCPIHRGYRAIIFRLRAVLWSG